MPKSVEHSVWFEVREEELVSPPAPLGDSRKLPQSSPSPHSFSVSALEKHSY